MQQENNGQPTDRGEQAAPVHQRGEGRQGTDGKGNDQTGYLRVLPVAQVKGTFRQLFRLSHRQPQAPAEGARRQDQGRRAL